MKILWIVNKPIGALHEKLMGKKSTGGLWMEAMLEKARTDAEMHIVIVNIANVKNVEKYIYGNETYYTIPGLPNEHYNYKSAEAHMCWRNIIKEEQPDLIELWGTELPYGIPALEEAKDIPAVVYVQGILDSIGKYYQAGMTPKELIKARTLRDVLTRSTIIDLQKNYLKRSKVEAIIVNMAKNIIVENQWAESYYMKMCRDVHVYRCPLSISEVFESVQWTSHNMQPHTIMCSAANYPIKGLHMLLKALSIVKLHYPDVKLFIPGTPLRRINSIQSWFKRNGYDKFIHSLISDLELEDVVSYTGRLTAEGMAHKMSEVNAFVMCSAIENHSSTLKEAMSVGVPCVASYVGGVPEYAISGSNCLLYRFEDYELLALHLMNLFRSNELCSKLSAQSRNDMKIGREQNDFYLISKYIYKCLVSNKFQENIL